MRLLTSKYRNFKGQRSFAYEPNGKDVAIYGDNGSGKTTLGDGHLWLLFDKDSQGRKDFEIKTLTADGEPIHRLEHEVSETFVMDDGSTLTLSKLYKEEWTKKRGSAKAEFSGHTTDYKVNGVPVQKKEYDAWIAGIGDEKKFRLLSDPTYFNLTLSWQERRKMLLEICGDITDADVIASNPKLSPLPAILGTHSLENYRKIIQARRTAINDEIEKIPVRIDELSRADVACVYPETRDLAVVNAEIVALSEKRAQIVAGGGAAEKTKALREIESKILDYQNQARVKAMGGADEVRSKLNAAENAYSSASNKANILHEEVEAGRVRLGQMDSFLVKLRQSFEDEDAKPFAWDGTDTCAACGQPLPPEKVADARALALELFNTAKAERLEIIQVEGKEKGARKEALAAEIEAKAADLAIVKESLPSLSAARDQLKDEVASFKVPDLTSDAGFAALQSKKQEIETEIAELQESWSTTVGEIDIAIREARFEISEVEKAKARADEAESRKERVKELEGQEEKLSIEIERIDKELFLTEEFIRAKVSMLEERINSKFTFARFKLFNVQVNGAVQETCETVVNGVPYGSLNHGSRLNVGLDIINVLAEHCGFAPPVIIDNAESVTSILPTKGQQIQLVVSESDKALRVVVKDSQTSAKAQEELSLV